MARCLAGNSNARSRSNSPTARDRCLLLFRFRIGHEYEVRAFRHGIRRLALIAIPLHCDDHGKRRLDCP